MFTQNQDFVGIINVANATSATITGLPTGVTVGAVDPVGTGLRITINGRPTQANEIYNIQVNATNNCGAGKQPSTVQSSAGSGVVVEQAPAMIYPQLRSVEVEVNKPLPLVEYEWQNFDSAPTYSVLPPLPAGVSINPQTGVISGVPAAVQPLSQHVVTASNGVQSASAYFVLVVTPVQTAFLSPSVQNVTGQVSVPIAPTQAFTTTGFSGTVTYSWNLLPASGLTIDSTTGVVSGTPTEAMADSAYTVTVSATDGVKTATATINVQVAAA